MLIGALALIATVVAAVGVYGVISFAVQQSTREIGILLLGSWSPDNEHRDPPGISTKP